MWGLSLKLQGGDTEWNQKSNLNFVILATANLEDHHQNKVCSLAQDIEKSQYRFSYHTGWRAGTAFRRQSVSATSASRHYDGGMQFFSLHSSRLKKSAGNKTISNSVYGDKTLSISLINWISKAVKDEKTANIVVVFATAV